MSLDLYIPSGRSLRPYIALLILREIAPTILDETQPITKRMALAYTFLKVVKACGRPIPEDISWDMSEWTMDTLRRIVDVLISFAVYVIHDML